MTQASVAIPLDLARSLVLAVTVALMLVYSGGDAPASEASAGPDLLVESISYAPPNPGQGVDVEVTLVVRNAGSDCISGCFFAVDFYQHLTSAPAPYQVGDVYCALDVPPAGQVVVCADKVVYAFAGTNQAWAQADTDQFLVETNEGNNVLGPVPTTVISDSDSDGVLNGQDNCPFWANTNQLLPPWPIPENDPDCDGFGTGTEDFVGTVFWRTCALLTSANNEPLPDHWPVDFNDNQLVNGQDILAYNFAFGLSTDGPPVFVPGVATFERTRFDLNGSGLINGSDILRFNNFFGKRCTP